MIYHQACTPSSSGTMDVGQCGPFMKCYHYENEFQKSNASLHNLYREQGGLCDCYHFWGYGGIDDEDPYPDCGRISSRSYLLFFFLSILPGILFITGFYLAVRSVAQLQEKGVFKPNVVGRGIGVNSIAAAAGLLWAICNGVAVFAPVVDRAQLSTRFIFNVVTGIYSVLFLPSMLTLPICWLHNVIMSKKMKRKKSEFVRGKWGLRVSGGVLSIGVVVLQGMRLYRETNFLISCVLILMGVVFHVCSRHILNFAGKVMPRGQQLVMEHLTWELTVLIVLYSLFAAGYVFTTNLRNWGTMPPIFIGLDMSCLALMHILLLRYFRYQCRKWLTASWLLRENVTWKYFDFETNKYKVRGGKVTGDLTTKSTVFEEEDEPRISNTNRSIKEVVTNPLKIPKGGRGDEAYDKWKGSVKGPAGKKTGATHDGGGVAL